MIVQTKALATWALSLGSLFNVCAALWVASTTASYVNMASLGPALNGAVTEAGLLRGEIQIVDRPLDILGHVVAEYQAPNGRTFTLLKESLLERIVKGPCTDVELLVHMAQFKRLPLVSFVARSQACTDCTMIATGESHGSPDPLEKGMRPMPCSR
jgi:hypothetical protein